MKQLIPKFFQENKIENENQKFELLNFYKRIGFKNFNKYKSYFKFLIRNNYRGRIENAINYKDKINKSISHFLKENYVYLFGEEEGAKIYSKRAKQRGCRIENYIEKYGEEEGRKLFQEKACNSKKGQATKEWYIKKYGGEEGLIIWNDIKKNWKDSFKKSLPNHKSKTHTLIDCINRYGEEEGTLKYLKKCENQSYRFSKNYYLEKYGKDEGLKEWIKYKERQDHCSPKAFIKKYGETDGIYRYNLYSEKQKSGFRTRIEDFILKYGKDEGGKRWESWKFNSVNNKENSSGYSKISQKMFWEIYERLELVGFKNLDKEIKFYELGGEQIFKINSEGFTIIFVDFKIKNCIIEFQGDYWHRTENSKLKDERRKLYLESKGYNVLFVYEKEYTKNKIETLEKCITFIKENYKND